MARKRLLSSLGILAGLGLMLSGCSSTTKAKVSSGAINTLCPMSGIPINPEIPTADYAGHKIGFCSNRCEAVWNNWGKAKRDAFVAKYR